ncbi:beta-L-arabinofuranosidase domain-containing protein [uncultured Paludibaculum sp.]|uniref:glycoside hydrolase family 127 protein n=1 Tax=uncultured Paludibaculum sp. TaxID=1765020 RepID=UPI002AABA02D|nr:beta-L-arabinofuranosidase domain-containing protein [uncultured Paludibaculum sp.]
MASRQSHPRISRRNLLKEAGRTAVATVVAAPVLQTAIVSCASAADAPPLHSEAGIDRVTILPGKTYLRGWAGYGSAPHPGRPRRRNAPPTPPTPQGPAPTIAWSKASGPGAVTFADAKAPITTATFSTPGSYVLKLTANNGQAESSATLQVLVETPPPAEQLGAVYTRNFQITSPLWKARAKALMVNWIPHCIDQINRTDIKVGPGGIDNFIEAGKALRGEPHGLHKGYVFSNAWVHQTVEAMSIALMIDAQGDAEIEAAHKKMRATLDDWIPKILAAQEPDGYLQTAFTLSRENYDGKVIDTKGYKHWDPAHRGDHEGYVAGYFLESAINHYLMTDKKDARLYNGAKKLADCWYNNLGPAPKKPWFDGHQQIEQGLVRFGRFVNDMEGGGKGDNYIQLAKFLLDSRYTTATGPDEQQEYDQSHLPVTQQYEAVGHAVRAAYTYSGMADVAVETHDPDYQSAVKSLWHNLVHRKYYVTGGIGSGETSEGFGPNYSLRNRGYCEACSSCGAIFFHWKLHLAYHDAKYVDLYEDTIYNALLGSVDLTGKYFYYDNPLDESTPRYEWHVCPCCVGNIPRTLLMLPTWAYSRTPDSVYVNLFVGSRIVLEKVAGTDVEMVQETDYPWSGKLALTVNPKDSKRFSVHIRMPDRAVSELYKPMPDSNGISSILVNGKPVKAASRNGYAVLDRTWKAGDKIEVELPLKPQHIKASDKIEATRGKLALRYGPLIYNIERKDQDITKRLSAKAPLTPEWRGDFLGGVVVLKGTFADGSPMLAIPNFVRENREPGLPLPPEEPRPDASGRRPPMPDATSIVWIKEEPAKA